MFRTSLVVFHGHAFSFSDDMYLEYGGLSPLSHNETSSYLTRDQSGAGPPHSKKRPHLTGIFTQLHEDLFYLSVNALCVSELE